MKDYRSEALVNIVIELSKKIEKQEQRILALENIASGNMGESIGGENEKKEKTSAELLDEWLNGFRGE